MKKLLGKKLNKNGFTLAELLIVVAIIAVLAAVALPLFFGALDGAKEAKNKANKRAVKSIITETILTKAELSAPQRIIEAADGSHLYVDAEHGVTARFWMANAFIAESGDILIEDIIPFTYDNDSNVNPNDLFPETWKWVEKNTAQPDYPIGLNGGALVSVEDTMKWVDDHGGAWCYSFILTNSDENFDAPPEPSEP